MVTWLTSDFDYLGLCPIVFHPTAYLFADSFDGLKNYFTYYGYLEQLGGQNFSKFEGMNYPFGEYLFYTDNTPLIAFPIKLITHYITGNGPASFAVYNYCVLAGLLFSSWLLYRILKHLLVTPWFIFGLSLCLPWLSPQINRISGHMNLSFSWLLLLTLYLLVLLWKRWGSHPSKSRKLLISLILTITLASFVHVYYLAILSLMVGAFCLFWGFKQYPNWQLGLRIQAIGLFIPIISGGIVYSIIRWIDTFYGYRKTSAGGYNWREYNLNFDALYSAYDFNHLPFFVRTSADFHFESFSYLGGFALYGLVLLASIFLLKKGKKQRFKRYFLESHQSWLVLAIIFMGSVGLITSLGEYARLFNATVNFDNVLNPFYFLRRISDRFTQFRCLSRFNWIFFWAFNIGIAYLINQYYLRSKKKRLTSVLLLGSLLFLAVETVERIVHEQRVPAKNLLLDTANEDIQHLTKGIDFSDYQAILPIPYYHARAEEAEYSLDPIEEWCTATYQLSLTTHLPLMSSKMSRAAMNQGKSLFSLFTETPVPTLLRDELSAKPILIFYSKREKDYFEPEFDLPKLVAQNSRTKVKDWNAFKIKEFGNWELYEVSVEELLK